MSRLLHHELFDDARAAFLAADRDGTAALNALILGGMVLIASSVTLVTAGGLAGVLLWALVWVGGCAAVALWLSPHLRAARDRRVLRVRAQRAVLETSRQRAVTLLLGETASEDERRAAAALLTGGGPLDAESIS